MVVGFDRSSVSRQSQGHLGAVSVFFPFPSARVVVSRRRGNSLSVVYTTGRWIDFGLFRGSCSSRVADWKRDTLARPFGLQVWG